MFPYTGITELFGSLIFFYLSFRFYRIYKIEKFVVGQFFGYVFFFFGLIFFSIGLPALSFVQNPMVWLQVVYLTCIFQILAGAFLGYIFFYLKFPEISPKWGFFLMLLIEIVLLIPTFIYPPIYFFEPSGVLNWETNPLVGILRYLGILFFLIPIGVIYLQEARKALEKRIKIRAYGLGLGFLGFAAVFLIDFILLSGLSLNPIWDDIFHGACFLILLVMILLTPKMMKRQPWVKFVK